MVEWFLFRQDLNLPEKPVVFLPHHAPLECAWLKGQVPKNFCSMEVGKEKLLFLLSMPRSSQAGTVCR